MKCLEAFEAHLVKLRRRHSEYIICGDWNIAHHEIDIKNWRGNKKNSGFLPEERAWLTNLFDNHKYKDAFRIVNNQEDQYTWWSNRGRAWDKNVGWRIDYQIVTPGLKDKVIETDIYKRERFLSKIFSIITSIKSLNSEANPLAQSILKITASAFELLVFDKESFKYSPWTISTNE